MTAIPMASGRRLLLGHTLSLLRKRFEFTSRLSAYGDIVKIYLGPLPTYVVTSPELTYRILVTEGNKFEKGMLFDKFRPFFGNGLAMSNGDFHRKQRRLVQPAFHHNQIAHYAETMSRTAAEFIDSWQPGQVIEVDQSMQELAVITTGRTLFNTELAEKLIAEAQRSMPIVIKQGMIRVLTPTLIAKIPFPGNKQFDQAIARLHNVIAELIATRRQDPTDHHDVLSTLLLARDDETGAGMNDQQLYDEVVTLLTGGIETTALALSWFFHELAQNPTIAQKVYQEVDQVFTGELVTFDDIAQLEYTRRVIDEVLRAYPMWLLMRRTCAEVELGGFRLERGTELIFSPHLLHHDPRFYPEPERFDPDRWLPEHMAKLPRGAFIPFGAGARQCIGNVFAKTAIAIAVATIVRKWQLIPVQGKPVRIKVADSAYPSQLPMTALPRHS